MTNRQRKETMFMFIVTDNRGNVNQNDTELSLPTSENGPDQNPEISSQVDMWQKKNKEGILIPG